MEHKLQLHIARQIAAVLVHCHMQSPPLVHVGIRPANVFIDEVGKMVRVAEPDFECVFPGFARDVANRDPTLAPEVRREGGGTLTTKADVWGLGVCMWSWWVVVVLCALSDSAISFYLHSHTSTPTHPPPTAPLENSSQALHPTLLYQVICLHNTLHLLWSV